MVYRKKECLNCGKITTNKKFCSISCSCSYNNEKNPRRKKDLSQRICSVCGKKARYRRKFCEECRIKHDPNSKQWDKITLGDIKKKRKYQAHSRIRELARKIFWKHYDKDLYKCPNCGYDKHIDVCHIKPIKLFSDDTKISKINTISNIIGLCKNCHWEFDQGILNIKTPS